MLRSRSSRRALLTLVVAVGAAASSVPAASAATQRYASPSGSGTVCSSASPCSVRQAVEDANSGDEVIVNPGNYPLTATLTDSGDKITIHGVAGQPRPRLLFSGPGQNGLRLYLGSTLRYVEIDQASADNGANALAAYFGAKVDQVIAKAPVDAVSIQDSTISNSIAVASGTNGRALVTNSGANLSITSTYRNVTAIATGSGGVPIEAKSSTTGSATVHLVNVIAYSGPGGLSLKASTDNSGAQAKITATHTNYQSSDVVGSGTAIVDGGGNRAEEPAFVNAAVGDYRQAAGAYTIDAGLNDPLNGAFDVDGDPRTIGTTDIGADEFVAAPTATTASAVTDPAASPTTQAPPATPPTQAFVGVRLVSSRLAFARGRITVTLRCPAGTVGRCTGRTKLAARHRRPGSSAASTVILGRAQFSIAPGQRVKVKVRVSRAGRRLLGGAHPLRAKDTNAARNGAGQSKTTVTAVTIRRRHR